MPQRIRSYAYGVVGVAAFGIVVLISSTYLIRERSATTAEAERGEAFVLNAAERVWAVLDSELRDKGKPDWAAGTIPGEDPGFPREKIFGAIPGVEAVRVRAADTLPNAAIFCTDREPVVRESFLRGPDAPDAVRIARDTGSSAVVAAFRVPRRGGPGEQSDVNVIIRPPDPGEIRRGFESQVAFGAVVLGVVIYLLAALAYLLRDTGERYASREREKSTRLRAVRDVAGGIAHELRNPLNAVGLSVQVIERRVRSAEPHDPTQARHFERVFLEIGRIKKVVDAFVKFARLGDLTVAPFDFAATVRETASAFAPLCADQRIAVDLVLPEGPVEIAGDREKLAEAVACVVQSALDAMPEGGGRLSIRLTADRRSARLTVRDSGPPLDAERLRDVFEPYRLARGAGGFGLTVAKTIVESHGGAIEAASPPGEGCEVALRIPRRFA
jgi:signal transduction histidine kinase